MKYAFFGQFLLNQEIIDTGQLTEAVKLQEKNNLEMGQIAIKNNVLSEDQVKDVIKLQLKEDLFFGEAAEKLNQISFAGIILDIMMPVGTANFQPKNIPKYMGGIKILEMIEALRINIVFFVDLKNPFFEQVFDSRKLRDIFSIFLHN